MHNQGAPIPAALLSRLFEPFTRADHPASLGLGMHIASLIVHAHGGRIQARPNALEGTTVSVWLPTHACTLPLEGPLA